MHVECPWDQRLKFAVYAFHCLSCRSAWTGMEESGSYGPKRKPDGPSLTDRIARNMFLASLVAIVWLFGVVVGKQQFFPYPQMKSVFDEAKLGFDRIRGEFQPEVSWFFYRRPPDGSVPITQTHLPDKVSQELLLVYGLGDDDLMSIRIMDNSGEVLHRWDVSAFDLWPDMSHVPADLRPKEEPSGELHGLELLPNGDVVFNFEPLGLMRLGFCGDVIWRLPMFTHHAVHLDESGILYVPEYPLSDDDAEGSIIEESILEVSLDGELLGQISILDMLKEADLVGLLYLSSIGTYGVDISETDVLHLNDVEPFPDHLEPGVFERGDIMVSLRNLNTVLVFNRKTRKIKYVYTGSVFMQHDPDFISGNEISVFDNRSLVPDSVGQSKRPSDVSSRIVILDARDNSARVYFQGTNEIPFFTDIMGKHQWLPNGDVLITESRWGRAFEITSDRELAWEFNNIVGNGKAKGLLAMIAEARRLPAEFDRAKLETLKKNCPSG